MCFSDKCADVQVCVVCVRVWLWLYVRCLYVNFCVCVGACVRVCVCVKRVLFTFAVGLSSPPIKTFTFFVFHSHFFSSSVFLLDFSSSSSFPLLFAFFSLSLLSGNCNSAKVSFADTFDTFAMSARLKKSIVSGSVSPANY